MLYPPGKKWVLLTHSATVLACPLKTGREASAHLGVLCGGKDVVKLAFQGLPVSQRPVGVLLVHKDDVLQDGLRPGSDGTALEGLP